MSVIIPRRWAACLVVLTTSFLLACVPPPPPPPGTPGVVESKPVAFVIVPASPPASWPMLGGTPGRNMANPIETNIPTTWSVDKDKPVNLKWSVPLGTYAYGGPVIAGGRIFVGTNNEKPRDPTIMGDKGILMCFDEATGKFLWQAVHDKLPNTAVNDTEKHGVASTPAIDGDRLYYVSNRCEMVCCDHPLARTARLISSGPST